MVKELLLYLWIVYKDFNGVYAPITGKARLILQDAHQSGHGLTLRIRQG
ncbi:hypothetical protein [Phormidium sp. FACHB-1136]|nr:hypothetical protein [Phormidium sp. FACHB-1136]MBD2424421.1 hypothetical protein [Phormidium sp. FACHB-1136]